MKQMILTMAAAVIIAGCAPRLATKVSPQLPLDLKPAATFAPLSSVINVPFELKTWYIEKIINQQLKNLIYECDTLSLGGMKPVKMKIWKQDSVTIGLEGNELTYRVPLKLWLQFSLNLSALGISHTEYQDVEASIALKFKSKISFKDNWKISTSTQPDGYEWLSDPVVKVRFVSIPIRPLGDLIISNQQATLGKLIDTAACSFLDLKKVLRPLWYRMQSPILVSQSPPVWLKLDPKGVSMTQLCGSHGSIKSTLGIRSIAQTYIGDQPQCSVTDSLPEFVNPAQIDSSFIINLYSELSFSSASELLQGMLRGRNFSSGKNDVIIQDVNVYGLEGYAIVSLDLTGSFKGKVYAIGHIGYDAATTTISITDLEFDISTQNALHSTAGWLLHGMILSKIQPFLRFPLHEKLLEAQIMAQKMMAHRELTKNVFLTGNVDSLSIGGVTISDKAIRAFILAKGSLFLSVQE